MLAGGYAYLASFTGSPAADYELFAGENSRPLVIAHRGGRGIAPENTLTAFQKSSDLGVDVLELDIHATKDGELVVIHDKSVDRTTNGKGLVAEMTFDEIRELDAGYQWSRDDGKTFPFRGKGIRIPTLKEVFEAFPDKIINIESKYTEPSPVNKLCSYIKEFNRPDKTIFASFHKEVLQDFRQNCPQVATSASPSESTWFLSMYKIGLGENYKAEMQALQIPQRIFGSEIVTKEFLQAARSQNLQVHVWTINKSEDMKRLIEIGVDGIMTDYPDRLLEVIEKLP
jgi:glycerophosphoryl diester phosphodiesterase